MARPWAALLAFVAVMAGAALLTAASGMGRAAAAAQAEAVRYGDAVRYEDAIRYGEAIRHDDALLHGGAARHKGAMQPGEAPRYEETVRTTLPFFDVALRVWPVPRAGAPGDDLVVLGRTYETNEVRLHLLRVGPGGIVSLWQSGNLFERASPVAMAAGDFRGTGGVEVAVVTNSTVRLFALAAPPGGHNGATGSAAPVRDGLVEVWSGPNPLGRALDAVALRLRPGRPHRLGLTRVRGVQGGLPEKEIVWFRWRGTGWRREPGTLAVGNMRSAASAVLGLAGKGGRDAPVEAGAAAYGATADGATADGATADGSIADGSIANGAIANGAIADGAPTDGGPGDGAAAGGGALAAEALVTEAGAGTAPGVVDVWVNGPGGFRRLASHHLRPAAIFAMGAGNPGRTPEGWVAVGDNRGRVGLYRGEGGGGLREWGEPIPVGWGLTDATLADTDGDGTPEMVVLGYPARLHVVAVYP